MKLFHDRTVRRRKQVALFGNWDQAVYWTATHMGERDRPIKKPKDHIYPFSRRLGLYRIVRELLNNLMKHAQARNARLWVRRNGDEIQITLKDDGVGFDATEAGHGFGPGGGFGLFSIREQLRHIGGRLKIESCPGRGTRAVGEAPLASIEDAGP